MIEPSKSLSREQKKKQLQGAIFGGGTMFAAGFSILVVELVLGYLPLPFLAFLPFLIGSHLIFIAFVKLINQAELWQGYIKGFANSFKYLFLALSWSFFSFILVMMSYVMGEYVYFYARSENLNHTNHREPEPSFISLLMNITIFIGLSYLAYKAFQDGRSWWAEPQLMFNEEENMIICPNCQNENPSTKKQCYVCGTPLP